MATGGQKGADHKPMSEKGHENAHEPTTTNANETPERSNGGGLAELGIRRAFCDALETMSIREPAAVQRQAIPALLSGRHAVIESGTGTGKTLAYLLPMLERLDPDGKKMQGMVIVPTQELAMQIVRLADGLMGSGRTAALIGGASLKRQIDRLKGGPVLAVGTPGRLAELLRLGKLKPGHIRMAVVDEADQVFALGETGEAAAVLAALPKAKQLVFVSATITAETAKQAAKWMGDPLQISGPSQAEVFASVKHQYTVCPQRNKIDVIRRFVRTVNPAAALLFVGDSGRIGEIEAKLQYAGLAAESLYADAGKQDRASVMRRLAAGSLQIVIATDLAARGLDVPHLTHVLQFEPPADAKTYLHRAGRTGRMGRSGTVVTLVSPAEKAMLGRLGNRLDLSLEQMTLSHGQWVPIEEGGGSDRTQPRSAQPSSERSTDGRPSTGRAAADRTSTDRSAAGRPSSDRSAAGRPTTDRSATDRRSTGHPAPGAKKKSPRNRPRKRDTKNKGAPRWLKEKQQRDET